MLKSSISILSDPDLSVAAFDQTYAPGEILFLEGDVCHFIGAVIDGEIIIHSLDQEGRESTIQRIGPGQFFGDVMLFAFEETYLGNVMAQSATKVAFFTRTGFLKMLRSSELTLASYLNEIAKKTFELKQHIKLLSLATLRDQIRFYLSNEAKRQKSDTILLTMSRDALAVKLNVARPSLSRELSRMDRDGLIHCFRRKITILQK
jgi:CRP-like cAMP-binding protein